jgi:glycosyltransferase involved in cell wall biosynthesis
VVCGGGPLAEEVETAVERSGCASSIHRPGFLQADALARWYAFAGGFVLASVSEPWGLVANEAAAAALPLLISSRAGCAETLVPDPLGTTGARFDPFHVERTAEALAWLADRSEAERLDIGRRAREVVSAWGPERFAQGAVEAWEIARRSASRRPSLLSKGT